MIPHESRVLVAWLWPTYAGPRPCLWRCRCGQSGTSHDPLNAVRWHLAAHHPGA